MKNIKKDTKMSSYTVMSLSALSYCPDRVCVCVCVCVCVGISHCPHSPKCSSGMKSLNMHRNTLSYTLSLPLCHCS